MANQSDKIDRSILPIPDRPRSGLITYDARDPDTKYPPIKDLRPPEGVPNVLILLIDDVGFGAEPAYATFAPTRRRFPCRQLRSSCDRFVLLPLLSVSSLSIPRLQLLEVLGYTSLNLEFITAIDPVMPISDSLVGFRPRRHGFQLSQRHRELNATPPQPHKHLRYTFLL